MNAIIDWMQEVPFGKKHPAINGAFAALVVIALAMGL